MEVSGLETKVWFPVVTLIVGVVLKGLWDVRLERIKTEREREARKELREDTYRAKRDEFQREALLELQEAAQSLVRATGMQHHEDVMASRTGGKWGVNRYSEGTSDGYLQANVRVLRFSVRVQDESIRSLAKNLSSACSNHVFCKSENEAEANMVAVVAHFSELNERLGMLLRTNTGLV